MAKDEGMELFGIEELEKQFEKTLKKMPNRIDAMLDSLGATAKKKVSSKSPVLKSKRKDRNPGDLKSSWRKKKPKEYPRSNGIATVVRIQSTAPHAHLVEHGHEIVTRKRTRDSRGRFAKESYKLGKTSKLSSAGKKVFGVKLGGRVEGRNMLQETMKEMENSLYRQAKAIVDDICKEYE